MADARHDWARIALISSLIDCIVSSSEAGELKHIQ